MRISDWSSDVCSSDLTQVHRTPHLGILLTSTNSSLHPEGLTSQEAQAFGMAMITRFDVDWVRFGYADASLQDMVEYVLRTMQSFFLAPRSDKRLVGKVCGGTGRSRCAM